MHTRPPRAQAALSPRWRRLVRRDADGRPSERGDVWAAPHRWGCTLVAARTDKLLRRAPTGPDPGLLRCSSGLCSMRPALNVVELL
jgi:hypothetical protein